MLWMLPWSVICGCLWKRNGEDTEFADAQNLAADRRKVERLAGGLADGLHSQIVINQRLTRVDLRRRCYWTRGGHKQKEKHGAFCNDLEMLIYLWTVAEIIADLFANQRHSPGTALSRWSLHCQEARWSFYFLIYGSRDVKTLGISSCAANMMDYKRCTEGNLMKFSS